MEFFSQGQISGKVLDHLGLVASTIDKLKLIQKLDERLPVSKGKGAKTTMGQRIAAMIMNGLGFIDDRLYMFPDFLRNKPVEKLLGKGLLADDFNDDALGRALDKAYEYGITKLFSEVAFEIGVDQGLLGKSAHIDTSSFSLEGAYVEDVESSKKGNPEQFQDAAIQEKDQPIPRYGYSKDHRPDLKQMVINLATTGSAGFPIWMEPHSGNASDKKILHEAAKRMQAFCNQLKEAPSFMYVADSAMYDSCIKEAGAMLWLSRVPEQHKAAKDLLQRPDKDFCWTLLPKGYKVCEIETMYHSVHQRWAIIHSEQAYQRENETLNRRIQEERSGQSKALWHLGNQNFQCENDAKKAAEKLIKTFKYHSAIITVIAITKHTGRGRPAKGAQANVSGYQVESQLLQDEKKIELIRCQKGRFILATNQLDRALLPTIAILPEYKEQSKTESGFRFIKDDTFEVDSVYLKKPERIAALMMIMTLCLMVYSVAQYNLRCALQMADDTIPNQLKKETNKPTMKWVYRLFHGIQVLTIQLKEATQEIVINLNEVTKKIIHYFGGKAMQIYGLTPS
jgi:transposase